MEPPSQQLNDLMTRLGLANARDLRRCRPLVRRLARDLPTFDSVWIDALAQIRVLTPYQARLLESDHPELIEVGPCILVDEWVRDGRWTLCVAQHRLSRRKCLLTYIGVSDDSLPRARDGIRELIARLRGLAHASIVVPQGCDELNGRLVVVSPFSSGLTLQQLLVRRGRFPIPVVSAIARQLLDGLSTLEGCQVAHGDLRLNSIRLTSRGQIILLNPGVLPAAGSRVSIHDALAADSYDGIAPELIGSGATAGFRSDLYALGCLLWQLLAGRPPFPTGDPLGKLAAHQSRAIDDVRRWRPDTPADLATMIERLTRKDASQRPSGPREVRDSLRLGSRGGQAALSRFHASFGSIAQNHGSSRRSTSRFPWRTAAVLLFVMGGLSLSLLDAGARNELLRLTGRISDPQRSLQPAPTDRMDASRSDQLQPLPTKPINGVIELQSDRRYRVADIVTDRPLTIRCAGGTATIVVEGAPLRITAQSLHMSGLQFVVADGGERTAKATDAPPEAAKNSPYGTVLLAVKAQRVAVDRCRFERPAEAVPGTAIAWKVIDEDDPTGGRFVARDTTFLGDCRAVDVHAMPRLVGFDNCLKRGDGPLLQLLSTNRSNPLRLHLRLTTLRDSGAVVQWTATAATESIQPTLITLENCAFRPRSESAGLLNFVSPPPSGWERLLQINGEGSILTPETPLVTADAARIEALNLRVEGLVLDDFEFAGDGLELPASTVVATQAPRSTPAFPGCDVSRFEAIKSAAVVREAAHEYNTK